MPLIESALRATLKSEIETRLKAELSNPAVALALRRELDGAGFNGAPSGANNFDNALFNIKAKSLAAGLAAGTAAVPGSDIALVTLTKKITANEFANAVGNATIDWMKSEWVPILADTLSSVIAKQVTTYIKTATVIVPPGQVTTTPAGPGATTAPSPPATIT